MTPWVNDFPCNEFVEVITDYLDGAMAADDARSFSEHLAICGGCQSALERFRTVVG